ncbi:MAG: hypothetical protein ACSHX7_13830, partial [Luteolibacter sp.]
GAGILFFRHTRVDAAAVVQNDEVAEVSGDVIVGRYFLTLSGKARKMEVRGESVSNELMGEVEIDAKNPVVFVKVDWEEAGGGHGFAKLVLEVEGKETFTHVFDGAGDIDDFVEWKF